MEISDSKIVSIKDTSDSTWVTLKGINTIHKIGLGQDGCVRSQMLYKDDSDDSCDGDDEDEEDTICVDLFQISICDTGGVMIAPINKDLLCHVNGEELTSEINLLSGSNVEIADKKLKIIDGPPRKERKKLPPTPGVFLQMEPPPKPHRHNQSADGYVQPSPSNDVDISDWYLVHSPIIDPEVIQSLDTPAKLGNMAASFLSRQIHLYTDAKLSASTTDEVFKFLQHVATHQKNLLLTYLRDMSKNYEEMPEAERDRPVHSPAIHLLVEILRQILDPLSNVVLCLQMIRTFSHFPKNLVELIHCRATPAVLGCMAVYKDVTEIQQYGLDILAKIATYKAQLQEKLPIRETGVELIVRALKHHHRNLDIVQPGCRTLTRLTSTIEDMLDQLLDTEYQFCTEVEEAIEQYEILLKHIFEQAIPVVQEALQQFQNNLGVSKEGRHFLYNSSKMSLLMAKKKNRLLKSFSESKENPSLEEEVLKVENEVIYMPMAEAFTKVESKDNAKGILKKLNSLEIIEKKFCEDHKVRFVDDDNPDSYTSSDANSSDSDGERNIEPVLEIQETRILENMEHLSLLHNSTKLNDSFDSTFIQNKQFLSDNEEIECSIESWFSSFPFNESPVPEEYETMDFNLEGSRLEDNSYKTVENHYEEVEFLNIKDNSVDVDKKFVKQSGDDIEKEASGFSSHENVCKVQSTADRPFNRHNCVKHHYDHDKYTVADVKFLSKVINVQVVQYISSLVISGDNAQALQEVDQPVVAVLESSNAPSALLEFINHEMAKDKTMMDLDPSFVIQIIDAVHYRSVLYDLLQSTILDVVRCLQDVNGPHVLSLTMSCLLSVFTQDNLQSIIMDEEFLTKVKVHMEPSMDRLQDVPDFSLFKQRLYREDTL